MPNDGPDCELFGNFNSLSQVTPPTVVAGVVVVEVVASHLETPDLFISLPSGETIWKQISPYPQAKSIVSGEKVTYRNDLNLILSAIRVISAPIDHRDWAWVYHAVTIRDFHPRLRLSLSLKPPPHR